MILQAWFNWCVLKISVSQVLPPTTISSCTCSHGFSSIPEDRRIKYLTLDSLQQQNHTPGPCCNHGWTICFWQRFCRPSNAIVRILIIYVVLFRTPFMDERTWGNLLADLLRVYTKVIACSAGWINAKCPKGWYVDPHECALLLELLIIIV